MSPTTDGLRPMKRRRIKLGGPLRRRRVAGAAGVLLAILLALAAAIERLADRGSDWNRYDHQTFPVAHVVDGDTIRIRDAASEVPVRLIGIDAPELPDSHWAAEARDYVRARTLGRAVTLRLESTQTRDRYGRLLAYVYLSDSDCLNLDLIRDGQAYADRRFRHSYRPQYEMTENEARKKGRGLWKDVTEAQMPQWRRQWLRQRQR
ncbi:thermonuclease family protein [Fontivita pretiosa]|uniref:thermonuclease family protein n=1 Tax=Fontivita pretiosa TaxID=2989684 RepID=UPI003D171B8C